MKYLSPVQACLIWSELEQAYYNDHRYGGDVAEIYAYKFMRYDPTYHSPISRKGDSFLKSQRNVMMEVADSLYEILDMFERERNAIIEIQVGRAGDKDGWRRFGEWIKGENFDHRVHVMVRRKD